MTDPAKVKADRLRVAQAALDALVKRRERLELEHEAVVKAQALATERVAWLKQMPTGSTPTDDSKGMQ